MSDRMSIFINGVEVTTFDSISLKISIDKMAMSFSAKIYEFYIKVNCQDLVTINVNDKLAFTGFIEELDQTRDEGGVFTNISGRSLTGDLVDCSAKLYPGHWKSIMLDKLISYWANEYAITVKVGKGVLLGEPLKEFTINSGETVFNAISRACALRSIIPTTDEKGNIVLTVSMQDFSNTPLVDGENILSIRKKVTFLNRYSDVTVYSKVKVKGKPLNKTNIKVTAKSIDSEVSRFRPLVIKMSTDTSKSEVQSRANWEVSARLGKSLSVNMSLNTFTDQNGALYLPNILIPVKSKDLNISTNLLIRDVDYSYSNSGAILNISATNPEAYTV